MRKSEMKRWIVVCVFTILLPSFAWGQKDSTDTVSSYENRFIRPLVDVLQEIEQRFGVRLKFTPADIEGKMLTYADFRLIPSKRHCRMYFLPPSSSLSDKRNRFIE